jgi:sugar phosphate isomerase/epimerase
MIMLIGCGEWGFREMPIEAHFRIAKKFGFRYLEFGIGGDRIGRLPEHPTSADISAFRALTKEFDILTPFCCIENDFTLDDPRAHQEILRGVLEQIRCVAECGATHVRLFAGFRPMDEMTEAIWRQLIDAMLTCDELCRKLNLIIAIETHGTIQHNADGSATHINSATTDRAGLARLAQLLPPRIGFNYDPGNIKAAQPQDREYALPMINGRVNYCHLKDWKRRGDGWVACAIGDDDLDYASLLPRMRFEGTYLIEYEPLEDTEAGITRSLDYLQRIGMALRFE